MFDNYPPGAANDPNAPYNQVDPEYIDVAICISTTLSKSTNIPVNDYIAEAYDEYEIGDEGETIHNKGVDYDFSDCNLKEAFANNSYSISELLEVLEGYLLSDINKIPFTLNKINAKRLLEACKNWVVDEEEIILEE